MTQEIPKKMELQSTEKLGGFWKILGPGVVFLALAQGSGELIWWPSLVAKYGLFFIFLLIPACLLQLPVNYQLGRYTLLTGEAFFAGIIRLNKQFALIAWIMFIISFIWFGSYASAGGTAIAELTNFPKNWSTKGQSIFWAYITILFFFFLIMSIRKRKTYNLIEKIMWIIAVFTVVGLILAIATQPSVKQNLPIFLKSLLDINLKLPENWNSADMKLLVTAVMFSGLGGFWNLFYSNWIADKGKMGMAFYNKGIRYENQEWYTINDSTKSKKNYKPWVKILLTDSSIGVIGNLFTTLMLCLLAYTYLFPEGLVPSGWKIAVVQSRIFEAAFGTPGKIFFLAIAAAFLCDTWLTAVDTVSKIHAEFLVKFTRKIKISSDYIYYIMVVVLTIITGLTMLLAPPGPLILATGILSASGMILIIFCIMLLNFIKISKLLPNWAKPTFISKLIIWICLFSYIILFVVYLI